MHYYPINLDVRRRSCLVVGGGAVGTRKARVLVDCGAHVTVVSPRVEPKLRRLAAEGRLHWEPRAFRPGDLDGTFLVCGATADAAVNECIRIEARRRGVLSNLAQRPADGDFTLPSLVRRGGLLITISTSGASPALARHLRRSLTDQFGPEYGSLLALLQAIRQRLLERGHDPQGHRLIFRELVEGPLLDWLRQGDGEAIDAYLQQVLGRGSTRAHLLGAKDPEQG